VYCQKAIKFPANYYQLGGRSSFVSMTKEKLESRHGTNLNFLQASLSIHTSTALSLATPKHSSLPSHHPHSSLTATPRPTQRRTRTQPAQAHRPPEPAPQPHTPFERLATTEHHRSNSHIVRVTTVCVRTGRGSRLKFSSEWTSRCPPSSPSRACLSARAKRASVAVCGTVERWMPSEACGRVCLHSC
jgi:hypothetical protein